MWQALERGREIGHARCWVGGGGRGTEAPAAKPLFISSSPANKKSPLVRF